MSGSASRLALLPLRVHAAGSAASAAFVREVDALFSGILRDRLQDEGLALAPGGADAAADLLLSAEVHALDPGSAEEPFARLDVTLSVVPRSGGAPLYARRVETESRHADGDSAADPTGGTLGTSALGRAAASCVSALAAGLAERLRGA